MKSVTTLILMGLMTTSLSHATEDEMEWSIPKELAMGLKHHSYSDASLESSAAELSMDYTQVKVPLGKFNVGDHFMVPSISLEQTNFEVNNAPNAAGDPTLYTIKSQFMFIKKLDDKWMRIIQVTPSLHTDGDVLDDEAFSLTGLAIWKYNSTVNSGWTMGIGVNRLFGEYKPIPLVAYQYRPSPQTQIDVGFPVTRYEHRWKSNWTGFASIKPVGGNWRFKTTQEDKVNVSYSSWVASTGIRYQFKPKMWTTLELGQGFGRKFDIDTDDNTGEVDIDDSTAIMFSIGLHH